VLRHHDETLAIWPFWPMWRCLPQGAEKASKIVEKRSPNRSFFYSFNPFFGSKFNLK